MSRAGVDRHGAAPAAVAAEGFTRHPGREEFNRRYGSMTDERFLGRQDAVRHRLLTLPGYQPRSARKDGK